MSILLARSSNPEVSTVVQAVTIVGVLVGVFAFASLLVFIVYRLRRFIMRTENLNASPSTTTLEAGRASSSDSVATLPLYSKAALDMKVDVPSGPAPSYEESNSSDSNEERERGRAGMPSIPAPARTMNHFYGSDMTSHSRPSIFHAS